jgi:hypothetical protein
VQLASSSDSEGGFVRDERVERRRASDPSFSLAADVVDVVRVRFARRGGTGTCRESSSERDAEFSDGAG